MSDDALALTIVIVLFAAMLAGLVLIEVTDINGAQGKVTAIDAYYCSPTSDIPHYIVQLGGGRYYDVGDAAGKNMRVGECYLLRKGAFSNVYNLFEPIECKEGW